MPKSVMRLSTGSEMVIPEWCEPKRANLPRSPKWLKKFKFITHRKPSTINREWNLTELSTGLAVVQGQPTRRLAIKRGIGRILSAGCKKFSEAVRMEARKET